MIRLRLLFSTLAMMLASPLLADNEAPGAPRSLQAVRYSSTAGELLWNSASDNVIVVGYRIQRDDEQSGIKDARSLFEPALEPGRSYHYRINAIDRAGNEGPAMQVTLPAAIGESRQGEPVDDEDHDEDDENDENDDDGGQANLRVSTNRQRAGLLEGDPAGLGMALAIEREGTARPVTLSLESSDRDALGIEYSFSSNTLASNETDASLSLALNVTEAPLLRHERHFTIIADDGVSRAETAFVVDVTPTSAPDVYLLIGQSNMEGYSELGSRERYPGGQDERVARIRQLNVQPNNRNIFSRDALFTDESANIREPAFVIAEDPLHEPRYIEVDGKGATFVGLGLTFAKQALPMTTADIVLVPAAWGATGFCANANGKLAWNASATEHDFLGGTLLTDRALTRLNLTLRETGGVLRGIFWHQGGADSNNADCARTYRDNLSRLAKRLRREAEQDARGNEARGDEARIAFIVATQSKGDDERGRFSVFNPMKQQVDAAHRAVRQYIPFSGVVNNDDLVPPQYPCGQVSCVHFGADALREQGRRFHSVLKGIWSGMGTYHY